MELHVGNFRGVLMWHLINHTSKKKEEIFIPKISLYQESKYFIERRAMLNNGVTKSIDIVRNLTDEMRGCENKNMIEN